MCTHVLTGTLGVTFLSTPYTQAPFLVSTCLWSELPEKSQSTVYSFHDGVMEVDDDNEADSIFLLAKSRCLGWEHDALLSPFFVMFVTPRRKSGG